MTYKLFRIQASCPVVWQDTPRQYLGQPRVLVCTQVQKVPLRDKPCLLLLSSRCPEEASRSLSLCVYFSGSLSSLPFTLLSINYALKLCLLGAFVSRLPSDLWLSPVKVHLRHFTTVIPKVIGMFESSIAFLVKREPFYRVILAKHI